MRYGRREVLREVFGLGLAGAGCASLGRRQNQQSRGSTPDLIARENSRPGTTDWILNNPRIDPATKFRCPWIEGYCSHVSIRHGETLDIMVSTRPASPFGIDFYRLGYYGGAGATFVGHLGPFKGQSQPAPLIGRNRLCQCAWEPSVSLRITDDWLSGVYLGKLTTERENIDSYIIFIVRDDRPADFIFQCSTHTWQAYNRWPDHFALYDDGKQPWYCGPNVDVSYDRPYGRYCQIFDPPLSTGSGEFLLWEFPLAFWLEQHGYDVTYISNLDTHADPRGLRRAKGFLSVGHDEYYTLEMYDNLRAAIADGLNVGFFSGNTCCGRIDLRPSSKGTPSRVFGRIDYFGPRSEGMVKRFPTMGMFPFHSPNEGLLVGARSNSPPCTGGADWICTAPEHWIYAGTGMGRGDSIPGLIGWEFHGDPPQIPGLEVVATGPTQSAPGAPNGGTYTATVYAGPKGNFVFNASTIWWGDGVSAPPGYMRPKVYTEPRGPDRRVQRMTANILERMLGG